MMSNAITVSNKSIKTNSGVDICKFLCSIIVIMMHSNPFIHHPFLDNIFGIVNKLAVPFFFIASGYFLFIKKFSQDAAEFRNTFYKWIKRVSIMLLFWYIVYFAMFIPIFSYPPSQIVEMLLIDGTGGHLWYLIALINAAFIVYLLSKKDKVWVGLVLSLIAMLFITVVRTWFSAIDGLKDLSLTEFICSHVNRTINNGWVKGLFYVSIGYYYAKYCSNKDKKPLKFSVGFLLFAVSMALFAVEGFLVTRIIHPINTANWFFEIPASIFFFWVAFTVPIRLPKRISVFLRKTSAAVYNMHKLVIWGVTAALSCNADGLPIVSLIIAISVILSAAIVLLSDKFKLLKYIY